MYNRWYTYRNSKNLNEAEKKYIDTYLVKIGKIRWTLQKFVDDYKVFYSKYKRLPLPNAETEEERSVYSRYRYYTNKYNCNKEEFELLQSVGLVSADNVRKVVKKFVEKYNNFVKTHNRKPKKGISKEEDSLYGQYLRYTNPKYLNEEEIKYVKINLKKVEFVRESLIIFVRDYLKYVEKYNCNPKSNSTDDEGKMLYSRFAYYTYAPNIKNIEIQYLLDNGIKVRGLDKLEKYNRKLEL